MSHCATASKSMQQFYREKSGIEAHVIWNDNNSGKMNSMFSDVEGKYNWFFFFTSKHLKTWKWKYAVEPLFYIPPFWVSCYFTHFL